VKTTEQGLMAGLSRGQPEEVGIFSEYLDLSRFPGGSVWDDLVCYLRAQLDGSAYLQACLASHLPVDLVVIMLGSNDLKPVFNRTPLRIANRCRSADRSSLFQPMESTVYTSRPNQRKSSELPLP
jgi:hypothetical protein